MPDLSSAGAPCPRALCQVTGPGFGSPTPAAATVLPPQSPGGRKLQPAWHHIHATLGGRSHCCPPGASGSPRQSRGGRLGAGQAAHRIPDPLPVGLTAPPRCAFIPDTSYRGQPATNSPSSPAGRDPRRLLRALGKGAPQAGTGSMQPALLWIWLFQSPPSPRLERLVKQRSPSEALLAAGRVEGWAGV